MVDKVVNRYCFHKINVGIGRPTELRSVWSEVRLPVRAKGLFYRNVKTGFGLHPISYSNLPEGPFVECKAASALSWSLLEHVWNVMTHAQKPDLVFRRNGRVHFNRRGRQFSRLLAAEVCTSAVVMLDTPCSEVVWRVLATHSTRMFTLHFPYRTSPCAIKFQLSSTHLLLRLRMSGRLPPCALYASMTCIEAH